MRLPPGSRHQPKQDQHPTPRCGQPRRTAAPECPTDQHLHPAARDRVLPDAGGGVAVGERDREPARDHEGDAQAEEPRDKQQEVGLT